MKNVTKFPLGLWVLLSASSASFLEARVHHLWFDDSSSLFDTSWVDNIVDFQEKSLANLKERVANLGPSKEQQEALKAAQTKLSAIKQQITEDASKVTISFSGFEGLDKKDIKIVRKKRGWLGTITLKNGTIEFFITKNGIQTTRHVELKNEEDDQKQKSTFYSSSSAIESERFKNPISIQTVKAEPIKDNTLTITAERSKEEVLPIP